MKTEKYNVIALIPAYQPNENLKILVNELKKRKFRIVIVNDGSEEKYTEIFKKISDKATVLSYQKNLGKGHALKNGLEYIISVYKKNFTVVTLDADGQHRVSDAVKLAYKSLSNKDCLILGSRKINGNVPFRSKFGNTITRFVFKKKTGLYIYDTQTGLRAFSNRLAEYLLKIPGSGYEYEMNVLMQCTYDKIPVIEERIETIYLKGNKSSHFNPIHDSVKIYKAIFNFKKKSGGKNNVDK